METSFKKEPAKFNSPDQQQNEKITGQDSQGKHTLSSVIKIDKSKVHFAAMNSEPANSIINHFSEGFQNFNI